MHAALKTTVKTYSEQRGTMQLAVDACSTADSRFFKTLTDQVITVELKNDLCITGTLKSVDQ